MGKSGLQEQLDLETRKTLQYLLDKMRIEHDSEVGKFVLAEFWPEWDEHSVYSQVYSVESVFDFLTELSRDEAQ